jgi:nitroreductase
MTPIHTPSVLDAPVLEAVAERWSTRIFDADTPIDEVALASALEAARWAPSAANTQPWRFIVARRGTAAHEAVSATLAGFNAAWAPSAGALVVVLAEKATDDGTPMRWAEYDAGQSAAFFVLQAHEAGLATHQMGGFDRAAISRDFALDPTTEPIAIIAVGAAGDPHAAPADLRERESVPRTRRPLIESLIVDA